MADSFVTGVVEKHHSHLCVGGPLSGRRYLAKSEHGFTVPLRPEISLKAQPHNAVDGITVETMQYKRDTFHTTDGDISFWVPNDQSPLQTMTILLDSYEKDHRPSYKTPNEVRKAHNLPPLDNWDNGND